MKVWLPTSCPSASIRCTRSGLACAFSPMMKKLAWTPFSFRMSRIFGVQSGSGPSSKVSASSFGCVAGTLNHERGRHAL